MDQITYNQMASHRNLGLAYLEEERYSDAANEFNMLVETAPKEPLAYANLGLTYMRMSGKLKQSEESLQKALKLVPNDPNNPEAKWIEYSKVENILTHPEDKKFYRQLIHSLIDLI